MGYTDSTGRFRKTEAAIVRIPLAGAILAAGTPLAAFANATTTTPGVTLDNSKAVGIRWNNDAAPAAFWTTVGMPTDRAPGTAMTLRILAAKSGATSGDAVTFVVTAFNQVAAALQDADTDFGGTTTAMTGAATAKTVQACTLTLASADLAASPADMSLSIKPTAGTLGTDDVTIHAILLEYTRALISSS